MPTERLSMRQIREILRLHHSVGMSQHAVARSLGLAQGTVSKYLNRTRRAGLTWPLPPELDDDVLLENRLYPPPSDLPGDKRPQPDWAVVHQELRRASVTLMLLWEEYCATTSDGFSYSWFCESYKQWAGRLKLTLRQVHIAGEKLFVDYSGHTMEVIDGLSGEVHAAQIFVAVLGASNYTFAEATFTQSLPDWISSHVRAFVFMGGVAQQTVIDNLKAGITRACFHEPMVNRTYADLARHYATAILPARPYHPRDKAKVEVGVQIVGRWILARLRNRSFFSLAALNEAIRGLLVDLNDRKLRGWGRSRRQLFDELDRPALMRLPDEPYEYAEWKRCRVNLDYHVEIAKHYYSVPHSFARQEVEARITVRTVEIFLRGKRIASHLRSTLPHRPTTIAEHMPSSHRRYRDWTHERIRHDAAKIGPDADTLIDVILRSRPHPEQGFRSTIGILGLVKRYGPERLNAACARALLLNASSYKSVAAILKNGTDKAAAPKQETAPILIHSNIRGRGYYN
jgi:transposase